MKDEHIPAAELNWAPIEKQTASRTKKSCANNCKNRQSGSDRNKLRSQFSTWKTGLCSVARTPLGTSVTEWQICLSAWEEPTVLSKFTPLGLGFHFAWLHRTAGGASSRCSLYTELWELEFLQVMRSVNPSDNFVSLSAFSCLVKVMDFVAHIQNENQPATSINPFFFLS